MVKLSIQEFSGNRVHPRFNYSITGGSIATLLIDNINHCECQYVVNKEVMNLNISYFVEYMSKVDLWS